MFKINGEKWYIKFVNPSSIFLKTNEEEYTIGSCDNETKTIYLNSRLRGNQLKKVLCHEIVHCAMFSYNIFLTFKQEELLADLIATYGEEIIYITNKIFKKLQ